MSLIDIITQPIPEAPSAEVEAARERAIWYAFGSLDTMTGADKGMMDMLDASNFALLYGGMLDIPQPTPTITWAWRAYVEARREGVTKLSPADLARRAAKVASRL